MDLLFWVGLFIDSLQLGYYWFVMVGEKYVQVLVQVVGVVLVLLFSLYFVLLVSFWLDCLQGLLLIGVVSNIDFCYYDGLLFWFGNLYDLVCDVNVFVLLQVVLVCDLLVLVICCGFQEFNVVLGGSLYLWLQWVLGMFDYCEDFVVMVDVQYGLVYVVVFILGGWLVGWVGVEMVRVNLVYGQGIVWFVLGLQVEVWVLDGLVEVVCSFMYCFVFGVQWYLEWCVVSDVFYYSIFCVFGDVCCCYFFIVDWL